MLHNSHVPAVPLQESKCVQLRLLQPFCKAGKGGPALGHRALKVANRDRVPFFGAGGSLGRACPQWPRTPPGCAASGESLTESGTAGGSACGCNAVNQKRMSVCERVYVSILENPQPGQMLANAKSGVQQRSVVSPIIHKIPFCLRICGLNEAHAEHVAGWSSSLSIVPPLSSLFVFASFKQPLLCA
eukprot:scaffold41571_cov17-Tisochrysis_lutea.AAC.4